MRRRKFMLITPLNYVVFEGQFDRRGRCDAEKVALNLLLRGVDSDVVANLRIFVELDGLTPARVAKEHHRLSDRIWRERQIDLSERQRQIAPMLIERKGNKEIAEALGISVRGVKFHISEMLIKFDCNDRIELARRLLALGVERFPPRKKVRPFEVSALGGAA